LYGALYASILKRLNQVAQTRQRPKGTLADDRT
jgi:hypothetical protein